MSNTSITTITATSPIPYDVECSETPPRHAVPPPFTPKLPVYQHSAPQTPLSQPPLPASKSTNGTARRKDNVRTSSPGRHRNAVPSNTNNSDAQRRLEQNARKRRQASEESDEFPDDSNASATEKFEALACETSATDMTAMDCSDGTFTANGTPDSQVPLSNPMSALTASFVSDTTSDHGPLADGLAPLAGEDGIFEVLLPGGENIGVAVNVQSSQVSYFLSPPDNPLGARLRQKQTQDKLKSILEQRIQKTVHLVVL